MTQYLRSAVRDYFNRAHLAVIIATLFVGVHVADDMARGEEVPPPFIPLILVALIYPLLPAILQALAVIAFGGIFFVAQIFGHVTPLLDRELGGSDYTGVFPMIGGAILIGVGLRLIMQFFARRAMA